MSCPTPSAETVTSRARHDTRQQRLGRESCGPTPRHPAPSSRRSWQAAPRCLARCTRVMIMPLAGATSLVCDNCVRDRSTVASAARNWARAAAMSSGTWPIDRLGECGLRLVKPCAAGVERHARIIEKLLGRGVAGGEALLPLECRLGIGERGLRGGKIGPRLLDLLWPGAGQQHVKLRLGGVTPCNGKIERRSGRWRGQALRSSRPASPGRLPALACRERYLRH